MRLAHQGLILVGVPLVLALALIGGVGVISSKANDEIANEANARSVAECCNGLYTIIVESAEKLTGFLLTGNSGMFDQQFIVTERGRMDENLQQLSALNAHADSHLSGRLAALNASLNAYFDFVQSVAKSQHNGAPSFLVSAQLRRVQPYIEDCASKTQDVLREEIKVRRSAHERYVQLAAGLYRMLALAAAACALVAIGLWVYFSRVAAERMRTLVDNTFRLAGQKPLHPRLVGGDEFAELDKVFHQMNDALAAANARKAELTQMVAHDLRSPLASISAALETLMAGKSGHVDERVRTDLSAIATNVDRLITLINNLLDAEMAETGSLKIMPEKASLQWIIQRSVEVVEATSLQKHIQIDYPDEAPSVEADADRIVQVLVNLLSNALKFSPPESTIAIEVAEREGFCEIRVSDGGRGIPHDRIANLFERYSQASADDRKSGSGLGLAICKAIVEAHGGTIGAENREHGGSSFWFRIPRAAVTISTVPAHIQP